MKPIFELLKRGLRADPRDAGSIANEVYNEAAGANKVMIVEPVVTKAVIAGEILPFGSYVKVTGTSYTLKLLNKAHNPATSYRRNDIVVQAGVIYVAEEANTGAFNVSQWRAVALETVGPVTIAAGAVVCNGKYHNNINAAGFLVDDDSEVLKVEI
jgi:hypothetical protein